MPYPGFRHLGLKFVSIGLAALLWLVVAGEQVVERGLRIPLEFTNLAPQMEIVGDVPPVVDVRVRGSSGVLSRISPGELIAMLDLRSARPGRRLFHLTATEVRSPFGVEVVQIAPSNVAITIERSASKVVPVVPAVEGEPANGYVVGTVTAKPATVDVVGPVSALTNLTEAITEPVSVAGASEPVRESVTIGVPDPAVRLRTPQSAEVTVAITSAPIERAVSNVAVHARGGRRAQVSPNRVTVYVRGPRETITSASVFDASVDVDGLGPGQFQLPVRVVPPARVTVVRIEPPQVRVRIH